MRNYRAHFGTYTEACDYAGRLKRKWQVVASIEETESGYDVTWQMK